MPRTSTPARKNDRRAGGARAGKPTIPRIGEEMWALVYDAERDRWDKTRGFRKERVARPKLDAKDPLDASAVILKVKYTGGTSEMYAVTENKVQAKRLLRMMGLPTADWAVAPDWTGLEEGRRWIICHNPAEAERDREIVGAGAGRSGLPAGAELLRGALLQSVDELHALARAPRRSHHGRTRSGAEIPRR